MRYLVAALLGALLMALAWGGYERWQHTGWRDHAKALERASVAARNAQEALRARERQAYMEQANEADTRYRPALAGVRADTSRHLDARRVQNGSCSAPGGVGQAGAAGVLAPVPAGVVVDEADVQTCGDLYAYSVAARDWALSVGQ